MEKKKDVVSNARNAGAEDLELIDFIFHAAPLVADNPGLEKNREVCIIVMQK